MPTDVSPIRILLIDDHEIFVAGLRLLIRNDPGLTVIGEAADRATALDAACLQPDVIVLDISLGTENGLDILPDLIRVARGAPVLVLTGLADQDLHLLAIQLGARGVIMKGESPQLLLKAIRKVCAGELWVNRSMAATVLMQAIQNPEFRKPNPEAVKINRLTERELQVIAFAGEGLRNKVIAERLFISDKTVRHYFSSVFDKLEVRDRLELLIYSYQHGLAKLPSRTQAKV